MAKTLVWNGRPADHAEDHPVVLWLWWTPKSAQEQPVMTIWAVPSHIRAVTGAALEKVAAPEAAAWMQALDSRGEVWRDITHRLEWRWVEGGLQSGIPAPKRPRRR
jgi:hypothetical protein